MEGDMKDIVLARLERRLKDKDEEIRSLKNRLREKQPEDLKEKVKGLEKKTEHLESELRQTQTTLSEVMKKIGSLESVLTGIMIANAAEDEEMDDVIDPDLGLGGVPNPESFNLYGKYVAAKTDPASIMSEAENLSPDGASEESGKNALRFFHMNRNP
ncbi:hypothetical protein CUJ83_01635 [Methanocella sp. CWC-04]|uniref:Uncharacterized protein n=1 Tax=Methanooceanicella nereidis TaxID=2052831 RepID=A0AAP2W639_9EURY|nr:hypothetical protein [Methanocella sp. CWC-04]MCD1293696.1 hypothetical protein [Methanocella sp. CWC-04]